MIRVLLTLDWFLKYGAEQAIGLKSAGAEVVVICRDHLDEFGGSRVEWEDHVDRMRRADIPVAVVSGRTASLLAFRTACRALYRSHRWHPDIVHAHPNVDPWLLMTARRLPLVMTIHDPRPHPGQPGYTVPRRVISATWRRRADGFIVHGARLRDTFVPRSHGRPIAVVPHGLTPMAVPDPVPARRSVLFFGRLEPYKGITVLMNAMRTVWREQPDVELVVAGRGPSAAEVIEHPKIRRIFRYVPEEELDDLLRAATLVAAPYIEASQSGVVSQAIARGIPAVVTNEGALPDLAVDPSFVVPSGDSDALASALLLHLDHAAPVRERVHRLAREQLSWPVTGRLTIAFYKQLLSNHTAR